MTFPLFAPRRAQPASGPGNTPVAASSSGRGGGASKAGPRRSVHGYAREAAALLLLASALYTALALASFEADPMRPEVMGSDWVGPVGALFARSVVETVGVVAWLLPIELALLATPLLNGRPSIVNVTRLSGDVVVVMILAALAHVAFPQATAFGAMPLGGSVGELFGELLRTLFSTIGSYIIGLTVVALILIGRATFSFIEWVQRAERTLVALARRIAAWVRALLGAWAEARALDEQQKEEARRAAEPKIVEDASSDAIIASLADAESGRTPDQLASAPIIIATSERGTSLPSLKEVLIKSPQVAAPAPVITELAEPAPEPAAPPKPRRGRRAAKDAGDTAAQQRPAREPAPAHQEEEAPRAPAIVRDAETPAPVIVRDAETPAPVIVRDAETPLPAPAPVRASRATTERKAASRRPAPIPTPIEERGDTPTPSDELALALISENASDDLPADESMTPSPAFDEQNELSEAPVAAFVEELPAARSRAVVDEPPAGRSRAVVDEPSAARSRAVIDEPPAARSRAVVDEPPAALKIVDTSSALTSHKAETTRVVPAVGQGFRLPNTDLLEPAPEGERMQIDEDDLKQMAQQLEKTLSDYGVSGKVEEIHPGPTVTTFEVIPAAGTKVSKVAGLADDLALGLSRKVRIIAPIPGKNRIGFEIPNEHRMPVNLRELIEDRRFQEMKAPLPCVLGRDIIGKPFFADLSSMPHMIVAGATGAGKSVGLNVMLVSLLYRRTPEELRLLMVDPKVVELAPFDRIPHLLLPVVTDMKQASNALKWAVDEMERRYQLFANAGTKNITTYNAWVERVHRGEARPPKPPAKVSAIAADGSEVEVPAARDGSDASLPEKIPYIVIVVDEFADLMMQQGKDVEASVARLAQKARAAGMHVILATQRPSVDVITGMIKANFPTRMAFRVAQKVDSRTILDEQGAEHLLGRGDMLVKLNGSNDTRRVQCPFCSEEEVQRVTDFLRLQGEPVYDEAILKPRDEDGEESDTSDAEADPMYDAAVRIVADTRRCSTSWIQRKLGIGYNRAAKLVEAMEKRGIVGPANGAKDREVLIAAL